MDLRSRLAQIDDRVAAVGLFYEIEQLVPLLPGLVFRQCSHRAFDREDQVMATANGSSYGLAAAVWTRDIAKAHRVAAQLRAGTVWVNCYNIFDASLPFGGYKQSGWGREMGHEVLNNYTETKAVVVAL